MGIDKLSKEERESVLESLIRRVHIAEKTGNIKDKNLYESKLKAEAIKYRQDYGVFYFRKVPAEQSTMHKGINGESGDY